MEMGWSLTIPLISWQEITVDLPMLMSTWSMVVSLWWQIEY